MDTKSLERRVEENSFSIENIVSIQKNLLVWELDIVDSAKNSFTFFCGSGNACVSLLLIANGIVGGRVLIDQKIVGFNKNFVTLDTQLSRGNHTIKVETTAAIFGGRLDLKVGGGKK